jgi:hypothetical protein
MEEASAHFLLGLPNGTNETVASGVSPRDLATGEYTITPLWQIGNEMAAVMEEAFNESAQNVLPRRATPEALSPMQSQELSQSLDALESLDLVLRKSSKLNFESEQTERHASQHIFSFSSLVHNPESIAAFCQAVSANHNIFGEVDRKIIGGIAQHPDQTEAGVFVCVNLLTPVALL